MNENPFSQPTLRLSPYPKDPPYVLPVLPTAGPMDCPLKKLKNRFEVRCVAYVSLLTFLWNLWPGPPDLALVTKDRKQ